MDQTAEGKAVAALVSQIAMVEVHVERVELKQGRHMRDTVEWCLAGAEVVYWRMLLRTLIAISQGKTVQPS